MIFFGAVRFQFSASLLKAINVKWLSGSVPLNQLKATENPRGWLGTIKLFLGDCLGVWVIWMGWDRLFLFFGWRGGGVGAVRVILRLGGFKWFLGVGCFGVGSWGFGVLGFWGFGGLGGWDLAAFGGGLEFVCVCVCVCVSRPPFLPLV